MALSSIGVVGAGQMGGGIAQVCAAAGYSVVMRDISETATSRGLQAIHASLARFVAKGTLAEAERNATIERLRPTTKLGDLHDCEIVIEAATEDPEVKFAIFRELDAMCCPNTILASNTSSIAITAIAAQTARPDRVIGMHFFNPVPLMNLVEIVRGLVTSDSTYTAVEELARTLGKTPVEVNDSPGFVSNRILMPMINEAIFTLGEGVANAEAIDTVMKLGMNHPMGPLRLADLIGLDTCLAIMEVLHRDFADSKYRPAPLLRKMVLAGRLGKKSGQGFYEY